VEEVAVNQYYKCIQKHFCAMFIITDPTLPAHCRKPFFALSHC